MTMIERPAPDVTATGKKHFQVLDGMRGSAAILVVLFHIMGMTVAWEDKGQLLHHAALAVDFFFLLSGFVVAYAYDDRWRDMTAGQFIAIRLVRLHPLVLLGAVLGLLSFLFDPFPDNQKTVPAATLLVDFALACLVLPYAALPNRWTDTHSLDSPAWSLLQEYIGTLLYAVILRRLSTNALAIVVALAGGALIFVGWSENSLDRGSDWTSWWMGGVRMAFSFTFGLWLYRVRGRVPKLQFGWLAATAILAALFAMPLVPKSLPHGNGIYHLVMVMVFFPLLVLGGAHWQIGGGEMMVCKLAGRLSYPIYMLHFPFLLIYMNYVTFTKPPVETAQFVAVGAFIVVMVCAWAALTFYDEPVRKRLRRWTARSSR